jgi:acyl-coenzyme A synthetase/AMP-(fatty) acid ligase
MGNGLRPEIWDEFQKRFNVPEIGEFYGATEGNIALLNHCTTPEAQGACGRSGYIMRTMQVLPSVRPLFFDRNIS